VELPKWTTTFRSDGFSPLRASWIVLRLVFWKFVLWNAGRDHGSRTHAQWMCFILRRTMDKELGR
jgi:hypothetical protein